MDAIRISSRTAGVSLLGAVATALLVLLMHHLISSEPFDLDERPPGMFLTFLPVIEDLPPKPKDRKPEKPPQPIELPQFPNLPIVDAVATVIGFPIIEPPAQQTISPTAGGSVDGDHLPIVKVTPNYPPRAQERGIEGYVLVEFTIDDAGRVIAPSVIEAQPEGVFERAALKAVQRFKYRPRVLNGEAIPVRGVRHLLTFELGS